MQNDNIEGSCKALHDFYGLTCVEPIKMGCWAYGRVFWGGLWILSVGNLGNNKAL